LKMILRRSGKALMASRSCMLNVFCKSSFIVRFLISLCFWYEIFRCNSVVVSMKIFLTSTSAILCWNYLAIMKI
jgi:hypothetical protein